ncbi:MAG TPA: MBL fold metallo-hydrolase [Candidatus Woesebacteria bacterium]|nr:MBL fold metallo-hydrolase [Candidatus Woesebacteria bacterium]HPR99596.1 MBL fold metallo-hydrolase [Candidatus Woesebacteria bacterium]
MEIKYFNQGKIYLKGKKENVWVNPDKDDLQSKNYEARIVIYTDKQRNIVKLGEEGGRVIIAGPGEYEIGGIEINGINSMYVLTIDGIKVVLMGKGEGEISEKKKEKLEEADVLMIGVQAGSAQIAKKSAANYVIPIEYENNKEELKEFLDIFDSENLESVDSLRVEKENLPEAMEVVLLKTN